MVCLMLLLIIVRKVTNMMALHSKLHSSIYQPAFHSLHLQRITLTSVCWFHYLLKKYNKIKFKRKSRMKAVVITAIFTFYQLMVDLQNWMLVKHIAAHKN